MMQMKESVNMPKANISIVLFNNENEIQQRMDVLRPFLLMRQFHKFISLTTILRIKRVNSLRITLKTFQKSR